MKKLLYLASFLPSFLFAGFTTDNLVATSTFTLRTSTMVLNGTTYYWRAGTGTSGQCLTTDGAVTPALTFEDCSGGGMTANSTFYIQNRGSLQDGATFYVSSGTVAGTFTASSSTISGWTLAGINNDYFLINPRSSGIKLRVDRTEGEINIGNSASASSVVFKSQNSLGSGTLSYTGPTNGYYSNSTIGLASGKDLRLYDSIDSHYVAFKASPTVSLNNTYVVPSSSGTVNQAITTDGANNLRFQDVIISTNGLQPGVTFYVSSGTATNLTATNATLTNATIGTSLITNMYANFGSPYLVPYLDATNKFTTNANFLFADFAQILYGPSILATVQMGAFNGATVVAYDNDSSNFVGLKSSATVTSNNTYVLPASSGTAGQAILTDGANNLYFGTVSGSGGGGYSVEPATVTFLLDKGFRTSTGTYTSLSPGVMHIVSGSSNVTTGLVSLSTEVTGVLPLASMSSGATYYIQNTNSLQSGATFYVSSGTVQGNFNVVTSSNGKNNYEYSYTYFTDDFFDSKYLYEKKYLPESDGVYGGLGYYLYASTRTEDVVRNGDPYMLLGPNKGSGGSVGLAAGNASISLTSSTANVYIRSLYDAIGMDSLNRLYLNSSTVTVYGSNLQTFETSPGAIRLRESLDSDGIILKGRSSVTGDVIFNLPSVGASTNTVLRIDSVGSSQYNLEFASVRQSMGFSQVFNAEQGKLPTSNPCVISNAGSLTIPALLCDASTDESVTWSTMLTEYTTTTMRADIYYTMVSTNSGNVVHNISVMCASSTYSSALDTESFGSVNTSTISVPSVIGRVGVATMTLTNMDTGCVQGGLIIFKYNRDANASHDTAPGDIAVRKVWIREP